MVRERIAPSLKRPLDELVEIFDFSYLQPISELLEPVLASRDFRVARALLSGFNIQASDEQIADVLIRKELLPMEVEIYNIKDNNLFVDESLLLDFLANLGVVPPQEYDRYQLTLGRDIAFLHRGLFSWDGKDVTVKEIPALLLLEFSRPTKLQGISVVVAVNEDKPGSSRTEEPIEFQYIKIVVSPDAYSITA